MEKLDQIIFYTLDKAIKSYRQFAQKNISRQNIKLTIDQWLIVTTILGNDDITQQQIGELVFKDYASVARMIELLVQKGIIIREAYPEDRRRSKLRVSDLGREVLAQMTPVIHSNRSTALAGISEDEIAQLKLILTKITQNCATAASMVERSE